MRPLLVVDGVQSVCASGSSTAGNVQRDSRPHSGLSFTMSCEPFSFYGVRSDGSVASWDFLECQNEAVATQHANWLAADNPDVQAVEVWSLTGLRFTVRT